MFSWKAVNVAASTQHRVRYVPVHCLVDHRLQGPSASTKSEYFDARSLFFNAANLCKKRIWHT